MKSFVKRIRPTVTNHFGSFAMGIIILLSLALYHPALSSGYLNDDFDILAAVTQPGFTPWAAFPAGTGTYFRPLFTFALYLEQQIAPGNPAWMHHAVNLGIHILNTILVYALCSTVFSQRQLALLLALLFCVHPANTHDIYIINGRVDSQGAFFYLLGSLFFMGYLKTGRLRHLAGSGISQAAVLLTKEFGITLWAVWALLLLLWHGWVDPGLPSKRLKTAWGWCTAGLIVSLIFAAAVYFRFYLHPPASAILPSPNLPDAFEGLLTFPILFVFPNHHARLIHLYKENQWLLPTGVILGIIMLSGSLLFMIRHKAVRGAAQGLLLLGLVFAPASLLLIVGGISSRQIYLPLAMLCIGAAFLARAYRPSVRWLAGLAALGILLSLPATIQEMKNWDQRKGLLHSLCQEFRLLVPASATDPHLILLNPPAEIFFNDTSRALYYCQYSQHGEYPHLIPFARLSTEQMQLPEVRLAQPGSGTYEISVTSELDYFLFAKGISAGQSFETTLGKVDILSQRPDGYIDGYRVRFLPQVLASSYLIFFDGQHFKLLSSPGASSLP